MMKLQYGSLNKFNILFVNLVYVKL